MTITNTINLLITIPLQSIKLSLEIYPLAKGQTEADKDLRLGFAVNDLAATIKLLKEKETEFLSEPMQTDYGFMTIIKDPDGRKIELYEK